MKKRTKQLASIIINTIIFFALIGTAFAVSYIFGLFFVLAYVIILYNRDVKRKPWKMVLVFIGALITRVALGRALRTLPNVEISLDFIVSVLLIIFVFLLGWRIKKS